MWHVDRWLFIFVECGHPAYAEESLCTRCDKLVKPIKSGVCIREYVWCMFHTKTNMFGWVVCNSMHHIIICIYVYINIYIYIYILRVAGAQRSRYYCSVSHRPWLLLLMGYTLLKIYWLCLLCLYIYITLFHLIHYYAYHVSK